MTIQQLTHGISGGEGLHLEFKKRTPAPERLAKEIVAFANTRGGRLVLGVNDDGTVTGVKDAAEEEFALAEALRRHCEPQVAVELERVAVSRKRQAIVVSVSESRAKPHYVVDGDLGRRTAYVRVQDMSVEASPEAKRLMKRRHDAHNVLFEIREKERLLLRYLDRYGRISVNQFARLAGISRKSASRTLVLLTRADMLEHHLATDEDYFTPGKELRIFS